MIALELINPNIPTLNAEDSIAKATNIMDAQDVHYLPVVEDDQFKGFLAEEMLYSAVSDSASIGEYPLNPANNLVYGDQHFYEVAKLITNSEYGMLAVLDKENKYLGVIVTEELFQAFANTYSIQTPGSIIILSLKQLDYSLSEITRLVESENAKVIACHIETTSGDHNDLQITLKIDKTNITHIVSTLERFKYNIIATYQEEVVISYEKERLDALMKYLNI